MEKTDLFVNFQSIWPNPYSSEVTHQISIPDASVDWLRNTSGLGEVFFLYKCIQLMNKSFISKAGTLKKISEWELIVSSLPKSYYQALWKRKVTHCSIFTQNSQETIRSWHLLPFLIIHPLLHAHLCSSLSPLAVGRLGFCLRKFCFKLRWVRSWL